MTGGSYDWGQHRKGINREHYHPNDDADDDVQDSHGNLVSSRDSFMTRPALSQCFPIVGHAFKSILQLFLCNFTVSVEVYHLAKVSVGTKIN
jgi:hypothetical protein